MYIRKTVRKYKGKTYENYLLVESVSTPKGPRQKVICSLGDLKPKPADEWLRMAHRIESALIGQKEILSGEDQGVRDAVRKIIERKQRFVKEERRKEEEKMADKNDDIVSVRTNLVTTERHREAGPVHVGYQFWKRLGFDETLAKIGLSERARILTCVMIMNRLVYPCSEHAMPDWIHTTALEDILGVNLESLAEDSLYRNMDRLYPNRASIESVLAEKEKTLFNLDSTIFFYDLTSTYFEGQAKKNKKAKLGFSRDKRSDCKQVLIGLVINKDGFPRAHEVFEGNKRDKQTLGDMLDALDKRVGLVEGQTVVIDRGMAFVDNLEDILRRKLHYLVAARQSERDEYLGEFEDLEGFEEVIRKPSPLNRYQKKSQVRIKMKRCESGTHVICISSERTAKDRAIREKKEQHLQVDLAKLQERVCRGRLVKTVKIGEAIGRLKERYPRVARYYCIEFAEDTKQISYSIDEDKMAKAKELDGSYLLKTDRKDLSADEVWRIYSLLTRCENAFRAMKSPLCERPIFHQVEKRTETHIFLCVMAYHLLIAIEKKLLDKGVHTSWESVREILTTHQVSTTILPTDKGPVLQIRKGSTPEPQHLEIYDLLEIPVQVMKAIRTWVDHDNGYSDEKDP